MAKRARQPELNPAREAAITTLRNVEDKLSNAIAALPAMLRDVQDVRIKIEGADGEEAKS